MTLPVDTYLQWRTQGAAALAFQESKPQGAPPPERWLQELWAHQRLRRGDLQTSLGRKLVVLHPGFWNREAGPDFLNAVLQFGEDPPVSGDIEIDLASSGWRAHGHAGNPAYHNVILHAVWDSPAAEPVLPTLVLKDQIDAPLSELETWLGGPGQTPADWLEGQCHAPLLQLPAPDLAELLRQAALVRLQTKALHFRARARATGWHQALWEGVFRALGYKHNAWPMQRLAELLPAIGAVPIESGEPRAIWEARLLGLSGLLPAEPKSGTYGRRLWDLWWREREPFDAQILPPALWRLHGVRPANHPQRRLALAAAWFSDPDWPRRLEAWFQAKPSGRDADRTLTEALRPTVHGFWRRHYTLSARDLGENLPLLGSGRINDLAVNVILPWFWARAESGSDVDPALRGYVESLYSHWPPGEDNTTLKLARARLLGSDAFPFQKTAAIQQGLLQIVRDFCAHSNALCENCRFPALVQAWRPTPAPT